MDVKVSTTMVNQGGRNRLTPSPASLDHSAQSYDENEGITFLPIEPNADKAFGSTRTRFGSLLDTIMAEMNIILAFLHYF